MKKLSLICSAALIMAGMSSTANAVTIRKAGNSMVLSGPITTTILGVSTTCTVTAVYDVPEMAGDGHTTFSHSLSTDPSHGHTVNLRSFSMSGGTGCSLATLHGTPTISVSPTTVTISGINATAIGGLITCAGSISGTYTHPGSPPPPNARVTFLNQTVGACTFSGTLTAAAGEFDIDATP
ncbi:hypothetical protein [Sphingomonas fennica]|uniref:hypothetical protein n=1 Tax=Edaphosphingomonas fennica TaxID=114404 RepID=UPI0011B1F66F|nr:hypothetical protein [Sphingomonas fennica]